MSRPLFVGFSTLALWAVGCGDTPRALDWEVVFDSDADAARAVRVETRIIAGGCAGTMELYAASIERASPGAPAPSRLAPGRYGFAAVAIGDACDAYAAGCAEVSLPVADGERITVILDADGPGALCPAADCVAGRCTPGIPDAGRDAPPDAPPPDARPDAPVAPPTPVLIASGIGSSPTVDVTAPEDAWVLSLSTDAFTLRGGLALAEAELSVDGMRRLRAHTIRDAMSGEPIHVSAALATPLGIGPHALGHAVSPSRADATGERWAYALVSESAAPLREVMSGGFEASDMTMLTERSVILVVGRGGVSIESEGERLVLDVGVDGLPCAVTQVEQITSETHRNLDASALCVQAVDPGMRVISARLGGSGGDASARDLVLSYAVFSEDAGRIHGTAMNEAEVRVTGPGALVAYAWGRFAGLGAFVDLALLVNGAPCARSLTDGSPTDVSVACVYPVDADGTVSITTAQAAGAGIAPLGATVGWLFLAE